MYKTCNGSIIAQDVFQRKLDAVFLSVPGVTGIVDDMIMYETNGQEHDGNILNFLEVCRKNNLTLNPDKMQFRLPKASVFGQTWSDKRLSANPKKIEAVKRMQLRQGVEATSINLQETYGGNFPKDPEVSSEKLPISTFQHAVQERSGNSTSRHS